MRDSPPTCPSGLPRLGACFAGSSSCCPLLLGHCCWLLLVAAGRRGLFSAAGQRRLATERGGGGPEPIVGPPGLWTCRRVGCRWFHLVEQAANDNARLLPSAAARAPPTPARVGRPNRLLLAVMPAFLQCYCRLFVNPPEHNTAWPAWPTDRQTHLRSRTVRLGRVMSPGGAPSTGACDIRCAPDGGLADSRPSRRGPLAANHHPRGWWLGKSDALTQGGRVFFQGHATSFQCQRCAQPNQEAQTYEPATRIPSGELSSQPCPALSEARQLS